MAFAGLVSLRVKASCKKCRNVRCGISCIVRQGVFSPEPHLHGLRAGCCDVGL